MVVPFFIPLFPAIWYINRNLLTEQLPPYTEPTTELLVSAVGVSILGSILFATVVTAFIHRWSNQSDDHVPYRLRLFTPNSTALVLFLSFMFVVLIWGIIEIGNLGPAWVGELLQILLIPLAVPLVVLAPFTIQFHWAVIFGLVLCVLWMSFLANVCSDLVDHRSLSFLNN